MMDKKKPEGESGGGGGDGFNVIEWKAKPESQVIRHFFVKGHDVSEPTRRKPVGRTLLVINIPPFLQQDNLRQLFSPFGRIDEIFLHQKPTLSIPKDSGYFSSPIPGYKVAYIVFRDVRSVKDVINVNEGEIDPLVVSSDLKCGTKKWIEEYNSPLLIPPQDLEEDVKQFMIEYEKEEIRKKEQAKQASEADDEGWVTVTRTSSGGKRPGVKRTESMQEKLMAKKRRMEKGTLNITPAQIKATKARQLEDLKKKFDEDKQKIALLRQQRKFKPF